MVALDMVANVRLAWMVAFGVKFGEGGRVPYARHHGKSGKTPIGRFCLEIRQKTCAVLAYIRTSGLVNQSQKKPSVFSKNIVDA